ncbi:MAG TPA: DUF1800 domain-containing protein [Vicinamibacterales bacterium]|nr:DUF1800 domain-containing protein [Vicinamibacterales bacterium]
MPRGDRTLEHVLRRIGFGASTADLARYSGASLGSVIDNLLNYEQEPDDVDDHINKPEYVSVTTRGQFAPNTVVNDARQRELFRMVHSRRPLQEKMALFWHNHFATAFSKVNGTFGSVHATKMMAGRSDQTAGHMRGQYQLFRNMATGNFRELLTEVSRDPAMLVWLDGRNNTRQRPQENFGREILELFTIGIGQYTEADVVAAARVFTGWSVRFSGDRTTADTSYYEFVFNEANHDVTAKDFTFAVYTDGGKRIPARAASQGMQDGLDLIAALARQPATAHRLVQKLYAFFVSEVAAPDARVISDLANVYMQNDGNIKAVLRRLFTSEAFLGSTFGHYSWPVEFVVRAIKETGWNGLSVDAAMTPLANMGQSLYEPPDVNGWALGPEWFSTASMLARMNFAATLMANQKFNLGRELADYRQTPERVLDYMLNHFTYAPMSTDVYNALLEYLRAGGAWTGNETQLNNKSAGLARLIVASSEYQFN